MEIGTLDDRMCKLLYVVLLLLFLQHLEIFHSTLKLKLMAALALAAPVEICKHWHATLQMEPMKCALFKF